MTRLSYNPQAAGGMPEYDEQVALMEMVRLWDTRMPELQLLFHVPNGDNRGDKVLRYDRRTGKEYWFSPSGSRLKQAGAKAGVPDLILPVARQGYHGLVIELKRLKEGSLEPEQKWWLEQLKAQGWRAEMCRGHMAAWAVLEDYLGRKMPLQML